MGGIPLNQPIVGMAATSTGAGYWLVASDGGVFAFGDARFVGSMGGIPLNQPIVGMAATSTGVGYWLVASDGGIFAFGDAPFEGSLGAVVLTAPVTGLAATPSARGYWMATQDGAVYAFGDAPNLGAPPADQLTGVVVGLAARPAGDGYWLLVGSPRLPRGGRSILPEFRVVAFYGGSSTPALGVLGEGTPEQAAQRLLAQAAPYAAGDRPLMPAFELIASLALASPGPDGTYSGPTPIPVLRRYLDAVRAIGGILILDIQPGRADFLDEVRRYEDLLVEPDVSLALDPEWKVGPNQVPGQLIGTTDASAVNAVSAYLADLIARHHLPQKLLVVHRFTPEMVTNAAAVVTRPGLAIVFHCDGFGPPSAKLADYFDLTRPDLPRGLKLFYDEDVGLLQPADVLALVPPPDLVTYQ
jgi:hypothetical protein